MDSSTPKINEIIDDVVEREGPETDDPLDRGGRTAYGISKTSNPQAWEDDQVTEEEAREIYLKKYVRGPRFDQISPPFLMEQLVDFGVNSGPSISIRKLQHILGVKEDGIIGPNTLSTLLGKDPIDVNNRVMIERIKMIGRIVHRDPRQSRFINGWISRATEFYREQ